jgi:hypothetical protein
MSIRHAMGAVVLAGLIAGTAPGAPALAADEEGLFAVRGAGIADCTQYLEAREARSQQYFQFGGWMNGYLTGLNRFEEGTFDLVPWQNADFLASALANYCSQNPDQSFHNAVVLLAETLKPQRIESRSERVEIPVEGEEQPLRMYRTTLQRVQAALNEEGYDAGPADGEFGEATAQALRALQQDTDGLEVTGVPDQGTLLRLFYNDAGRPPQGGEMPAE